jgi:biotin carboxyl carrier protein
MITREVLANGELARLEIDGSRFLYRPAGGETVSGDFSIAETEPGVYVVLIGGRGYRVVPGPAGEVLVNGRVIKLEVFDPRDRPSRAMRSGPGERAQIAALMPGRIVRVLVDPEQSVEEGQGLVVVEAMKMQNEMKSPKTGRVSEIRARAGATVSAGEVLMVIE